MKHTISVLIACVCVSLAFPLAPGASTLSWNLTLEPSRVRFREVEPGRMQASVDGYPTLEYYDYPALPYRLMSFLVPQGEDVSSYRLEVVRSDTLRMPKPLALFRGAARDDGGIGGFAADTERGRLAAISPAQLRYIGSNMFRGYRIATFAVYPITCDGSAENLIIASEARLDVETIPRSAPAGTAERARYVEGFRAQSRELLGGMVVNPEAAAAYTFDEVRVDPGIRAFLPSFEPSMEGSDVAYVIVTNEAMASAFQRLADSKTKKGIPAVVRTVEWIQQHYRWGADVGESIRNFIREAYAKWGVEWVVLGGDTDVIPARFGRSLSGTDPLVPTDIYYSCLDGSWNADGDSLWGEAFHSVSDQGDNADLYAEVYIGRMPASTLAEADLLVDKTLNYAAPLDTISKEKFFLLGEVIFPSLWTPGETIILDGSEIIENVYNLYLDGKPDAVTSRLYENYTEWPGSTQLTRVRAIDSLNTGANHILHVGHGFNFNISVGDGSILNYDADHLTNGSALFSMYLMSCSNLAFDTECLAEAFLLNDTGGAFAMTGSSRSAYPSASRPYLDEYYRLMFTQNVVQLGKLFTLSRLPFTPAAQGETFDRWTHFIYNYLGDPEVCTFRGAAKSFVVSKPASASFGSNDITISVTSDGFPFDSALVCLYKEGDDYAFATTGPSGDAAFNDFLCKSSGAITVTVTGLDHGCYLGTIPVTQSIVPYLRVVSKKIEDTVVGNSDYALDAGETVNLKTKLKNTGQTTATKLYAKIRSTDQDVAVLDSTALFEDIPAGGEMWGSDGYLFGVAASMPDEHPVEFTIDVRDSMGGFWSEKFAFEVHAPKLELCVSTAVDTLPYGNNNGVVESGESFLLKIGVKNFGTGTAYGLTGKIRSLDPDITVTDSISAYNAVPPLGVTCGAGFVLSETSIEDPNYYTFELTDAYGRTFTKRMELRCPGAPTGLLLNATYGPTEIHLTWRGPDLLDTYRYQVYHSQTSGGPYTMANKDLASYTLYRDRDLISSTRYYYVVTAVDSCGNEGPRSAEKTATTSPGQLVGWPNVVGKETSSSVKIGDIDGDTHPDIVVGSDFIYAWHADGTELRDGDSLPLTWGVFSNLGDTYTATVALANLDGVPGLEIVGSSWNTKQIYIFNKNGAVLSGWPKTTTSLCWASPVVGDIDGDGGLEVIAYSVGGIVYAWHANGMEVRDGDANPATDGVFFVTNSMGMWHMSTPALADMDGDSKLELIVCSPGDSIYCLNEDGSPVPGWPVPVVDSGANITASPAVGDIDGDGYPEVVVQSSAARVYGLNHDGTWMTGWPKWVYSNTTTIAPSPALADFDADGKLEVVIAGLDKNCYVFRYNGTNFPGWPQAYSTTSTTESSPVIADIDGDGSLDIILGCEEGLFNAWKSNGQYVTGFPVEIRAFLRGTPVAYDLNFDGNVELITSCWNKNIYIWDLPGQWYNGFAQWNGFHGNIYNTGWKEFIPATAVDRITCIWRLVEEAIEMNWSLYAGDRTWNLHRKMGGGNFELLAAGLRADQGNVLNYVDRTVEAGVAYRYRLEAEGRSDLSFMTEEIMVPAAAARLYQNHPNPFNPSTAIPYTVPGGMDARRAVLLAVYDVRGTLVRTLVNGSMPGGRHEVRWDGVNARGERVASGIYFVQMRSGTFEATKKMVLLR